MLDEPGVKEPPPGTVIIFECPRHRFSISYTTIRADYRGRPSTWFRCIAGVPEGLRDSLRAGCVWTWEDLETFHRSGRPPILLRRAEPGEPLQSFLDGNLPERPPEEPEKEEPKQLTLFDS